MFLRNTWYGAAWSSEITRELMERTIIGESICLFRQEDGTAVALNNMCAHRFAPLHKGKLIGDAVQCQYHGLRYGADGHCTLNPHGDGQISERMRVKSYPLIERYDMIWLWMGSPELADESLIPDFSCHVDPNFHRIDGLFEIEANYELIADNLVDLTHAEFLHEGTFSSEAITRSDLELYKVGSTVWANRWCPNGDINPTWAAIFDNNNKPVDQWLYTRWDAPSTILLDLGATLVGRSRNEGVWMYGTDILTPKDDKTTYYFWAFSRCFRLDDPHLDELWRQAVKVGFEEQDKPMIEAQQRMLGRHNIDELKPALTAADQATTAIRRTLRKLLDDEQSGGELARPGGISLKELLASDKVDKCEPIPPLI